MLVVRLHVTTYSNGRRTERVDQILSVLALQRDDLTARASDIRVDVERFPQVVNRSRAGHSPHVQQYTNVWFQDRTESVEEPTVRVDLLLVLLLQAEDDLHGHEALLCAFDLHGRRNRNCADVTRMS